MPLHPLFSFGEEHTDELIALLDEAVLGTNGAHYRHLDTREKIEEADNIVHLSMERNDKLLGNISFCRRGPHWYVRYFAFRSGLQGGGQKKSNAKKSNLLRTELDNFFEMAFNGEFGQPVSSFYAYIDPNNERSLWMSENFGFETIAHVATQTFSRTRPRSSNRLELIEPSEALSIIREHFDQHQYYFEAQTKKPPIYGLRDDKGELIALAKISLARWQIKRLPGRFGGILTKLIPLIPGINKIIRPKDHAFVVPEAVYVKDGNPDILTELFESILSKEKRNLMIWWVDEKDVLYQKVKLKMNWGRLHKMVGVNRASVVQKKREDLLASEDPVFTSGIDFI